MRLKYLKNGETLQLNSGKCMGCGYCVEVCPHGVFEITNGKANITAKEYCMECGACKMNCPVGAIEVKSGVGCAAAIIRGQMSGTQPDCGCS